MGKEIINTAPAAWPAGVSPAGSGRTSELALDVQGLTKHFGGTKALDGTSIAVRRGTVHALLGGNGSGKSTLIKILAGVYEADAGSLGVLGTNYDLDSWRPQAAHDAGLRFVHQDLGMFEEMSVEENFALDAGYPRRRDGGIRWSYLRKRVRTLLDEYELDIDPRTPIHRLRPPDRTMVAIARAVQDQEGSEFVLVLDEPTASLAQHESLLLLGKIKRRAELGQTIIIVSHRLKEVRDVATDFTIFRDGRTAGTLVDASPTDEDLIELMAGRSIQALRPTGSSHATERQLLRITGLHAGPLRGVDLGVAEGEIVGIAGLVGSGRSSLLKTIFGAMAPTAGALTLRGEPFAPRHIEDSMDAGVALVPEDRGGEAAFADMTVSDNLSMSVLKETWRPQGMPRSRERSVARELISKFLIKVSGPDALFSSMSGGNQQKTVLARWMQRNPSLLLLDEPTQGVDVMSRADIYATIRAAAHDGAGVIVASSDVGELCALCDRVVILRAGVTGEVLSGNTLDPDNLTRLLLKENASDPTLSIATLLNAAHHSAPRPTGSENHA